MSIKYYQLAKDEELPEEFCAVRDVNGEPSEYTWYERMSEFERELWVLFTQSDWFAGSEYRKLQDENAKLVMKLNAEHLVRQNVERENAKLRELLAVLDNERGNMHIGSASVTITPTLDWTGVARELRAIADTLAGDAE